MKMGRFRNGETGDEELQAEGPTWTESRGR